MKENKFLLLLLFFVLIISSCVSQRPQYSTIQDGVRCPLATANVAVNAKPSERAPASAQAKPSDQVCDRLFGQSAQ